ncbi:hypothetical protein [Paracoccus sp. ME4]|uniref:hypothetical protein n=1 Tax=Paracoccus sp. ME4 TaxID=3138066 RepID=UPI00398A5EAA
MDIDARREELREHIARAYHAIRFSEIIPLVPDPAHRARIIAKAGELFGIPDRNDTGDKIFGATLTGSRLKEDSFSSKGDREKVRSDMVELLTESALTSEAAARGIAYGAEKFASPNNAKKEMMLDPFEDTPRAAPDPAPRAVVQGGMDRPRRPLSGAGRATAIPALTAPLYETDGPIRPLPPANFVSLLQPGPGSKADGRLLSRWLSGVPSHAGEWALGPRRFDAAGAQGFAEIETELLAAPEQYLERNGQDRALSPDGPGAGGTQPTDLMSRVMAAWPDNGLEAEAVDLFRRSLGTVISEYWPDRASDLAACGATLTVGSQLAAMLGAALAGERQWLEELGDDTGGPEQIVMGDVNPQGRIDEGLLFRRMAFLGYGCAMNATEALAEATVGLRFSLMHRFIDRTGEGRPCGNFDVLFGDDCARPMEDYIYLEPEAAPAP